MRDDVIQLRRFYASPLGLMTADLLAAWLAQWWPDLSGRHVAGIGYALPLLDRLPGTPASRVALMPAAQGVCLWGPGRGNATALIDEGDWPLPNGSYDALVLLHAVEVADHLSSLLREVWRVLNPAGRAIVMVPRRRGFWSSSDATPFGHGRPFSTDQIRRLMGDHLLPVVRRASPLVMPPLTRYGLWHLAPSLERLGPRLAPRFGGVLMVEVEKQLEGGVAARPRQLRAREPAAVPVGASV